MENNSFEQKVRSIDWEKYLESKFYDPNKMRFSPENLVKVLIELNQIDKFKSSDDFLSDVRCALGNDHRGTYYPAALEAIDLIIEVEKKSDNEKSRKFAKYVLNDLHYFQLEMSDEDKNLYDSISNAIREKLNHYSDKELKIFE